MVERVLLQESQKWEHNKPLKAKILNSFPQSKLSTLYAHRKAITGNIPGWLWIFSFYILSLVSFKLQEMILILFLSSTILSLVPQSLSLTPILCLRSGGRSPLGPWFQKVILATIQAILICSLKMSFCQPLMTTNLRESSSTQLLNLLSFCAFVGKAM